MSKPNSCLTQSKPKLARLALLLSGALVDWSLLLCLWSAGSGSDENCLYMGKVVNNKKGSSKDMHISRVLASSGVMYSCNPVWGRLSMSRFWSNNGRYIAR